MRLNKYLASATGMSRRAADTVIADGRVYLNGSLAQTGQNVAPNDSVMLDGGLVEVPVKYQTILVNKPAGYVVSRDGQGSRTIYDLLPLEFHQLKPVGRLDKESSGLLLLTNNGDLANELTHPSHQKSKIYHITLLKPLTRQDEQIIHTRGVTLEDGVSKLALKKLDDTRKRWEVTMAEGRNRQIRRTFAAAGYTVDALHRTHFGAYSLDNVAAGAFRSID
jgi:23S rRNA pseudouridine2605 synthase